MYYFDKEGMVLTLEEYMNLFGDWNYRRVAISFSNWGGKEINVSTVWLGISHGENEKGDHYIFETLIEKNGQYAGMIRYTNEKDAIDGHRAACLEYKVPYDQIP